MRRRPCREAHDDIGREIELDNGSSLLATCADAVTASHVAQHGRRPTGADRPGPARHAGRLPQGRDERSVDVVDLDRGKSEARDAVDRAGLADERREREPGTTVTKQPSFTPVSTISW